MARVSLPETRLGIIPGAGGTNRLKTLVGTSQAQQLILTGSVITGYDAYRIGLCNYKVNCDYREGSAETRDKDEPISNNQKIDFKDGGKSRARVLDVALKVANRICHGAPVAVSAALGATKGNSIQEIRAYRRCLTDGDRDRKEGLRAYLEKRPARFRGATKPTVIGLEKRLFRQVQEAQTSEQPGELAASEDAEVLEVLEELGEPDTGGMIRKMGLWADLEKRSQRFRETTDRTVTDLEKPIFQHVQEAEALEQPGELATPKNAKELEVPEKLGEPEISRKTDEVGEKAPEEPK